MGTRPAKDAVNAMWPPVPCSSNLGRNASTAWMEPQRSMSSTQRQSSCVICGDRARDDDAGVTEDDVDLAEQAERLIREVD